MWEGLAQRESCGSTLCYVLQSALGRFSMLICATIKPYTELFVVFLLVA